VFGHWFERMFGAIESGTACALFRTVFLFLLVGFVWRLFIWDLLWHYILIVEF
jgi:hypothetical protein